MNRKVENTRQGVVVNHYGKDNLNKSEKQILEPIYKDVANPQAVKAEIGDVILVFNQEIKKAKKEVDGRKFENPIKYNQRAFYSQDLNATIKEHIIKRMETDNVFNSKVKIRMNSGSIYFIIKDKYILYVKRLYGNQNKPNCFPTPTSAKLFNGTLFPGLEDHIPVLFIGPNLSNLNETDAFVTSLISKKEINWSLASNNLFSESEVKQLIVTNDAVESDKEVVRLKKGLESSSQKQINKK
ncbi:hypothetical protein [Flavobacterium sp. RS13.1]|jgi:hypothetical protein|uniref:hypothetical protein n=1 Tax=Flavobacterium sp. RS13.1 TaxID=3400345 RepID=UPI003AADC6A9